MSDLTLMNPISVLRHVHARSAGRVVFFGGGGSAPSSTTVEQTGLPDYAEPYFTRLLERTEAQSLAGYQPYGGQRIAERSGDTLGAQQLTRNIAQAGIAGLPQAMGVAAGNIAQGQQIARSAGTPSQFSAFDPTAFTGFEAGQAAPFTDFEAGQAQAFGYAPTEMFTGEAVERYMSPYMQAVVDEQSRRALQQYREQGGARAAQAVRAGAFGGSRQAVQSGMAERDLLDRLAGIQATGSQQAFQQAAQQFGADRAAQFAQQQAQAQELAREQGINIGEAARVQQARAAELARTQGINIGEAARVQQAQAAERARMQQIQAAERARVEAARAADRRAAEQTQLQALGFSAEQAGQMVGFGEMGRAADIQNAQLLEAVGQQEEAFRQRQLDVGYEDFLRQQAFPEQQLQLYSSILRGVPVEPTVTQVDYQPSNPLQRALGAGIGAVGLYRGLTA